MPDYAPRKSTARQVGRAYKEALGEVEMTFRATRQRAAVAELVAADSPPSLRLRLVGLAATFAALLVIGLVGWRADRDSLAAPPAPTAAVASKTLKEAGAPPRPPAESVLWVQAPAAQDVALGLGPAASGTLAAGGSARTRAHEPLGAEVWLEKGAVQLKIEPNTGGQWTVYAGPYRVNVIGTVFSVTWDGEQRVLAVEVSRGEVRVSGGDMSPRGLSIVGGQRVEVTSSGQEARVRRVDAGDKNTGGAAKRPTATKPLPSARNTGRKPAGGGAPADWRALFAKGRYARAYEVARAAGFEELMRTSNRKTLHDLADVARLRRDLEMAERTLKVIRLRFPRSDEAARAAFELGRIAVDQRRAATEARRWFDIYVKERPHGKWARDARGRILRLVAHEKDATARAAAQTYLRHHPEGPDAATARTILAP